MYANTISRLTCFAQPVVHAPLVFQEEAHVRIVFELEAGDRLITLEELQRRSETAYVKYVVEQIGKRSVVAAVLGVSRKGLWLRLKALGLNDLPTKPVSAEQQAEALGVTTATVSIAA
jgi:DNA-binding NtrC family response regulator